MQWKNYITVGTVAGVLSFIGVLSVAAGKPALGAFLTDPSTASTLTGVISGAIALLAGMSQGIKG